MYRPEIVGTINMVDKMHKDARDWNGSKIAEQNYIRMQVNVRDKHGKRDMANIRISGESIDKTWIEDAKVSILIQSFKLESDLCVFSAKPEDIQILK